MSVESVDGLTDGLKFEVSVGGPTDTSDGLNFAPGRKLLMDTSRQLKCSYTPKNRPRGTSDARIPLRIDLVAPQMLVYP